MIRSSTFAIIVGLVLVSQGQASDLVLIGLGSLERGGVMTPLEQLAENVADGQEITDSYRVVLFSGFSLEDIVIVNLADRGYKVRWRSGTYRNVNFWGCSLTRESTKKAADKKKELIVELINLLESPDTWKFEIPVTGLAMDDGNSVAYIKTNRNGETKFRVHKGKVLKEFSSLDEVRKIATRFWNLNME